VWGLRAVDGVLALSITALCGVIVGVVALPRYLTIFRHGQTLALGRPAIPERGAEWAHLLHASTSACGPYVFA